MIIILITITIIIMVNGNDHNDNETNACRVVSRSRVHGGEIGGCRAASGDPTIVDRRWVVITQNHVSEGHRKAWVVLQLLIIGKISTATVRGQSCKYPSSW